MAQRVQVNLIDDLNGEEAQETVRFSIDGTNYEIDLTTENAEKLRSTLGQYVDKGRRARGGRKNPGEPRTSSTSTSTSRTKREETQRIRQWAKDNGHNPSSRGRVNQSIVDAYNDAQK